MFVKIIALILFNGNFLYASASSYGIYCVQDSDCDKNQKCIHTLCRCNQLERRFWTGTTCAICAQTYSFTFDRCYKYFGELKTWSQARSHCRAQYADLFTWRNNHDEQFIRPIIQQWIGTPWFLQVWLVINQAKPANAYVSWAGAIMSSTDSPAVTWADPDGMKLNMKSKEWCDPTQHSGYVLQKEPSLGRRNGTNGTERENCITFNYGQKGSNFLCISDDFCNQKYPFICEMNAASMTLAVTGNDPIDTSSPSQTTIAPIDLESPPTPPPTSDDTSSISNQLSAQSEKTSAISSTFIIVIFIVILLIIVGAIIGFILIRKKKISVSQNIETTRVRSSFASSIASSMNE